MKGIIKVRNFDSLKKLSYKRAKGKKVNIVELNNKTRNSIITLDRLGLLTPELLWELLERRKYLYIEQEKLNYVIDCREKSLPLILENMNGYVNCLANIKIAALRLPFEVYSKYKNYVWKRDKDEDKKNGK